MSSDENMAMEMESPPPKKQLVLPSSSSVDFGKTKVCIVCRSRLAEDLAPDLSYDVFVVDLFSDKDGVPGPVACEEFKSRRPTFHFDDMCFKAEAFCVLDSTLYMFEGSPHAPVGKSVAAFDLSSLDLTTESSLKLERSMIICDESPLPDLLHHKNYPTAIRTPDGKILVFSNLIKSDPCAVNIDFELYDPTGSSSRELPRIRDNHDYRHSFWVEGYSVYEESSTFILQTRIGKFCLDLRSPDVRGWVKSDRLFGFSPIPCTTGPFFIIGDEFCLSSFGLFYNQKQPISGGFDQCCWFPFPFDSNYIRRAAACVPIRDDVDNSGYFDICFLHTGVEDSTQYPRLAMELYRCNVKAFIEDEKLRDKEILISFKFHLDVHRYSSLVPYDMFAF